MTLMVANLAYTATASRLLEPVVTSSIVLGSVVKRLGGVQSVRGLREQLQVQPSADMVGISIIAMGPDADSAASLANTVGIAYEEVAAERASPAAERAVRSIEKVRARRQAQLDATPGSPDGQLTPRQQRLSTRSSSWNNASRTP